MQEASNVVDDNQLINTVTESSHRFKHRPVAIAIQIEERRILQ